MVVFTKAGDDDEDEYSTIRTFSVLAMIILGLLLWIEPGTWYFKIYYFLLSNYIFYHKIKCFFFNSYYFELKTILVCNYKF